MRRLPRLSISLVLSSVHITYIGWLATICKSGVRGSDIFFSPLGAPTFLCAYTYILIHTGEMEREWEEGEEEEKHMHTFF